MAWIIGYFLAGIILAMFLYHHGEYQRVSAIAQQYLQEELDHFNIDLNDKGWVFLFFCITILFWPVRLMTLIIATGI